MHINREVHESLVRFRIGIGALIIVLLLGTLGFYYLEDGTNTILDSFYYTLVTISTVGYGDISPSNDASKILAIII